MSNSIVINIHTIRMIWKPKEQTRDVWLREKFGKIDRNGGDVPDHPQRRKIECENGSVDGLSICSLFAPRLPTCPFLNPKKQPSPRNLKLRWYRRCYPLSKRSEIMQIESRNHASPSLIVKLVQGRSLAQSGRPLIWFAGGGEVSGRNLAGRTEGHLRLFLCSVFSPLCTEQVVGPVPPCRSLCEQVRDDCLPVVETFNFPWPTLLNCSRFPDALEGAWLCMGLPTEDKETTFLAPTWAPVQCPTNFARALVPSGDSVTCSPRCGRDAYYRHEDKVFAQQWMTGCAWLCFLSTLFSLLTFCVEPQRYPERPVVFLALSYNLLSLGYIARGALGAEALSCVVPLDGGMSYVAVDGLESGACTLIFLALYYFSTACVLAACWFLSAAKKWSCESLHAVDHYFHLAAWLGPAVLGVAALGLHHVTGDELTGLCQVAEDSALPYLVVPQGALLLLGGVFATLAGSALVQVRYAMRMTGRSAEKLERLMTRLGVFAVLYVLPAAGSLACLLYEAWHRPRWRSLALLAALDCGIEPGCIPGPSYHSAGLEVALLRLFLSLVVGVTSGMWVWSGKTCRAWSKLFAAPRKPRLDSATQHVSRVLNLTGGLPVTCDRLQELKGTVLESLVYIVPGTSCSGGRVTANIIRQKLEARAEVSWPWGHKNSQLPDMLVQYSALAASGVEQESCRPLVHTYNQSTTREAVRLSHLFGEEGQFYEAVSDSRPLSPAKPAPVLTTRVSPETVSL
uniref:Frizzled-4 n=1 Tax=Timema bartmani TaxID=61472 RepID=A0A7R9EVY4_9NEOP|nr:unnamed protein product [Timema bartmani]